MASRGLQYRQGDLLLVAADALPVNVEPVAFAAKPLALVPSVSGPGSHLVDASPSLRAYCRRNGDGAIEWLDLTGTITLSHPEHASIMLEPGIWRVVRQREYDPVAGPRRVAD